MPHGKGYSLTAPAVRRLNRRLSDVRDLVMQREGRAGVLGDAPRAQFSGWVEITSLVQTGGRYHGQYGLDDEGSSDPGVITAQGSSNDIWVREANGRALQLGLWYWGRLEADTSAGVPVYVVFVPVPNDPLTTKGDIWVYSTTDARLPVGVDYNILQADSSTATGLSWVKKPLTDLFDHYADVATTHTDGTEDDLYSDTLAAGQFAQNGDKIIAEYAVTFAKHSLSTDQVKAYFGGNLILDSGANSYTSGSGGTANVHILVICESATTVRVKATFIPAGITLQPVVTYTRITGLTLSNPQILKLTGIATGTGAASGDITCVLGYVAYQRLAAP